MFSSKHMKYYEKKLSEIERQKLLKKTEEKNEE